MGLVWSIHGPYRSLSILTKVNHQRESRMREIRLSGSEGGAAQFNGSSLPLFDSIRSAAFINLDAMFVTTFAKFVSELTSMLY